MERVITKNQIRLLSPDILIQVVKLTEVKKPGWWWSLSQRKGILTISMGPGQNCPYPGDVELAKTKGGDEGYIHGTNFVEDSHEDLVVEWICKIHDYVDTHRSYIEVEFLNPHGQYRSQNQDQIDHLFAKYEDLLKELPLIEKEGFIFDEIYIGSCDFSVDCSLRGTDGEGQLFDIGVDITGQEDNIGDSVYWATCELKSEILTQRWINENKV